LLEKNKNRSGSINIQIAQKVNRSNKIIKTVSIANSKKEEELLILLARQEIARLQGMESLFIEHDVLVVESFVNRLQTIICR
jgi:hypothetical protein